jgi:hypothetical protein
MHRRRKEKLIDLAPSLPPSRTYPAVRVLRTEQELTAAQNRARAFECRDAERYERHQASSGLAQVLPLERPPELLGLGDLHPAGSGLREQGRARGLNSEIVGLGAG